MMMMCRIVFCLILAFPLVVFAGELPSKVGIVAIVNDDLITSLDVEERIMLLAATRKIPTDPSSRNEVTKRVLQSLVDEALKIQEAKRHSLSARQEDIQRAIASIERGEGRPQGSLTQFIRANNLPMESFTRQIKGEVLWNKLLARKVRQDISIEEAEVLRAQKRLSRGKEVEEVQIVSMILPLPEGKYADKIREVTKDITEALRRGEQASAIVKRYGNRLPINFSPTTWVRKDQLNPIITSAVAGLKKGDISDPIITPAGNQIIKLLNTRMRNTVPRNNAEIALKQIILKMDNQSSDLEIKTMMEVAKQVADNPGDCLRKGVAGVEEFDDLDIEINYIRTTLANMSPEVQPLVKPLEVMEITEPFAAPDGIHMLMVCERIDMPAPLPDKQQVKQILLQEKLELEAEKYLRNLRRDAFIDIRV